MIVKKQKMRRRGCPSNQLIIRLAGIGIAPFEGEALFWKYPYSYVRWA